MAGALTGTLMSAALIQMQKVKVMTEAAMVRLDQTLASNQLTMAGTAALPAFTLMAIAAISVRKIFAMNPPNTAAKTLRLRLLLTDVERSLQEVYQPQVTTGAGIPAKSPSRPLMASSGSSTTFDSGNISPRQVRERVLSTHSGPTAFTFATEPEETEAPLPHVDASAPTASGHAPNDETVAAQHYLEAVFGDEVDLGRQVPLVRVNSVGASAASGDTFRYAENARLISRGRLTATLVQLRRELIEAFTPRYMKWLSYLPAYLFDGVNGGRKMHPNSSWLGLPVRIFNRIVLGAPRGSAGDLEYDAILADVMKLEAPDDEVSGTDKIVVASSMRQSFRCFSMN